MKDSHAFSEKRSMFSENTIMTTLHHDSNKNDILACYYGLFPEYSKQYPYLSKIFFMQLLLKDNLLLLTDRRMLVKDIWLNLSKRLNMATPNIYVVDEKTNLQQLIVANFTSEKLSHRFMLLDIYKLSNLAINYILNKMPAEMNMLAVDNQKNPLSEQLRGIFSICFKDIKEDNFEDFLEKIHQKTERAVFNRLSFEQSLEALKDFLSRTQQQEGFLKPYMLILKQHLSESKIQIMHSKWKKAFKILQFIGSTKIEGCYKKFTLVDCILLPNFLATQSSELQIISRVNEQVLLQFIPLYGVQKFQKHILQHFWLSQQTKKYFSSLAQKLLGTVSFYYPCSKFPQTVAIHYEKKQVFYRISGHDKKLMSDKYFQINPTKAYKLQLTFKSSDQMTFHIGLACYDENKCIINPVQICRREGSEVIVDRIQDNRIYVKNEANLQKWEMNPKKQSFAYERCIGIYNSQDNNLLPIQNIIYDEKQSYSKQPDRGIYKAINLSQKYIELTDFGKKQFFLRSHLIKPHITKLMNHYEGGTYIIPYSANKHIEIWQTHQTTFESIKWENKGKSFFPGTKFVRIVLIINYNSGYPDFQVKNKNANFSFKEAYWYQL